MPRYLGAPAAPEDLETVCALVDCCDVHDLGRPDYAGFAVRRPWLEGRLNLRRGTVLVRTPEGEPAAYVQVLDGEVLGRVMPEHRGRGLGSALLEHVEGRADGPLEQEVGGENDGAVRLLVARGWELDWTSWYFRRELDTSLPEPVWPADVEVRAWRAGDEVPVHGMLREAFADNRGGELPPLRQWVEEDVRTSRFDAGTTQVAEVDGAVVGLCLAYPDPGEAWVKMLGVAPSLRGRGLGLALLHAAFRELRRRGHHSVGLEVDDANPTGARRLYLRAGMTEERRNRLFTWTPA